MLRFGALISLAIVAAALYSPGKLQSLLLLIQQNRYAIGFYFAFLAAVLFGAVLLHEGWLILTAQSAPQSSRPQNTPDNDSSSREDLILNH